MLSVIHEDWSFENEKKSERKNKKFSYKKYSEIWIRVFQFYPCSFAFASCSYSCTTRGTGSFYFNNKVIWILWRKGEDKIRELRGFFSSDSIPKKSKK